MKRKFINEKTIMRVVTTMPHGRVFTDQAHLYKLLSDVTRLKILWALSVETMCVTDLAALLSMTESAVSHQLKTLRLTNLVRFKRAGKVAYYSLNESAAKDIIDTFATK
jgi:ArsR family transcriptional regulator